VTGTNDVGAAIEDGRTKRASAIREQRRGLILDAAVRVFSELGYHQARVADIIDAAGIARGTFYLYFESKNAIFVELLGELLTHLRDSVIGVDTSRGSPPVGEQLFLTVRGVLETLASNRALTTILIREAVGLDEETDRMLMGFYESLHLLLTESLERGQAIGLVRPLDVDIVASCVLGSVRQVLERELVQKSDEPMDLDKVAGEILAYNARGLMVGS
jgi:AcrR family transcriptional regulator